MILEHVSNSVKGSRHRFGWLLFSGVHSSYLAP